MTHYRKIIHLPLMIWTFIGMCGCIHYEPVMIDGELGKDPTKVSVSFQLELSPTSTFINYLSRHSDSEDIYQRFIVEVTQRGAIIARKETIVPVTDIIGLSEYTLPYEISLHAVEYEVSVWSDYYTANSTSYNADMFTPVYCAIPYFGCSELKLCYCAHKAVDFRPYRDNWDYHHQINLSLNKPVAKYQIITTDAQDFLKSAKTDSLHIRVGYIGYHPIGYNVPSEMPDAHADGIYFYNTVAASDGDITGELCLAFDYIFSPPDDSQPAQIALTITDDNGRKIAEYNDIQFSYRAGKVTTISGRILTQQSSGGIGINKDWDDEIIIEI